jgi:cytochrome P450
LSDQELRDQVMTLLFAGHDTTTSTVSFLFLELGRTPDEVEPLVSSSGDEALDMAVDETLRMYPPAWIGPRRSVEAFELRGASVPAGVNVNYCSWASHHLVEVFPEPSRFRPSRFAPEAKAALPKGAYVPFGGGSRTCIGMRFGLLEVKSIAAAILRRFRLELADPERKVSIRQMPTLSPRGGMPVIVREP